MPRISNERLAATRRLILDGARRTFARHGFEGATVRRLEQEIGLSRGAIFHHFPDKAALFTALAVADAEQMADEVAQHGLVGVMRSLPGRDAGWLGTQLEVQRRQRTDSEFAAAWTQTRDQVRTASVTRLRRLRGAGRIRSDVEPEVLVDLLQLVLDGLVLHRALGMDDHDLTAVLDLVETTVRTAPQSPPARAAGSTTQSTSGRTT